MRPGLTNLDGFPSRKQRAKGAFIIMAENLSTLTIGIIDEFERIATLQQLLVICQEQLDENPSLTVQTRLQLLLDAYMSQFSYHFSEITWWLDKLRHVLGEAPQQDQ